MAEFTKDELDLRVKQVLARHWGRENSIGRWELVAEIFGAAAAEDRTDGNSADRRIRDAKERLRNKGEIICDLMGGEGTFMAKSAEEYRMFRKRYGAHAFPIMATIREMDKTAENTWPNPLQPGLFEQ